MNMNKKIIILILSLLTGTYAFGQVKHEFSIYAGGGLSTLLYEPASTVGKQDNGFGGLAGVGYTLFFNDYFGIGTGVEIALYNSKMKSPSLRSESPAFDVQEGVSFLYKSKLENFEEKQKANSVNIPLMLNFQMGSYHRFYVALGAKIGIPVVADFKSSTQEITTSGYYEFENFEYTNRPDLGFGTFSDEVKGNGDMKMKPAFLASGELGMKWSLGRNTALYTGFYADYGLNDIAKKENSITSYNSENPQDIGFNSILNSQYKRTTEKSENLVDKVSPLAVGIKIKLAFGSGINKEKKKKNDREELEGNNENNDKIEKNEKNDKKNSTDSYLADSLRKMLEDEEREAYLRNAAERRQKYKQDFVGDGVDKYGLSIVTLNSVQKRALQPYIEQMKKNPEVTVYITGHTCDIGSEAINLKIGQERADVAKDYMVEEGIVPSRIKTFTAGKSEPIVPNTNEANRKKNRRLEIQIK